MSNKGRSVAQKGKAVAVKLWKENLRFILFLILMIFFRSAIADWNRVPSGSMLPTIQIGDRILVEKMAYDLRVPLTHMVIAKLAQPGRGDIVIIDSQAAKERLVKRIVGLPGDSIQLNHNRLIVNGVVAQYSPTAFSPINEAVEDLTEAAFAGTTHQIRLEPTFDRTYASFGPVTVPPKKYLMLGDNRNNSADYRHYGFFDRDEIMGRVEMVAFSLDADRYFLPRWHRLFARLDKHV